MAADNVTANSGTGGAVFRTFSDGTNEWPAAAICLVTGGSAGAWTLSQADTNSGNKSAATLRVVLATDQPALTNKLLVTADPVTFASAQPVTQSGTWTVQPGNTANTTPWLVTARDDQTAASTAAWTSATALDTALSLAVTNYGSVFLSLNPTSTFTGGTLNFEVSDDGGTTWYPVQAARVDSFTTETTYAIVASTKRAWEVDVAGATNFRARLNPVITGTGTANLRVQAQATASDPSLTVGGTVTANQGGAPWSENVTQFGGNAVNLGTGTTGTGTLRVVLATDQPQLTNKLLVTPDANSAVNLSQVGGSAVATGHGTAAGALRVELPTDGTGLVNAAQNGTWIVQPGNTANTTPWLMQDVPATSGGLGLPYSFISTAAVQAANIKASAGQVYALHFFNSGTTPVYVRLYNQTTSPATTDTVVYRAMVPGNSGAAGFVVPVPCGVAFGTGIGIRVTGGAADNDATALAANAVFGNVFYK